MPTAVPAMPMPLYQWEQDLLDLRTALTGHMCRSYEDIAQLTGWSLAKVGITLSMARSKARDGELDWTVPHVPRGPGYDHLFFVVEVGMPPLDPDERASARAGTISTCRTVDTQGQNLAHALRTMAQVAQDPREARALRKLATVLDGVAAMGADAADRIELNGILT